MTADLEKLLTIDEVSRRLSVSVSTVRRIVRDGTLPAYRVGGRLRFKLHEVEAYIDAQRIHTADPRLASTADR
jgi:excisionase family DNA binding protein